MVRAAHFLHLIALVLLIQLSPAHAAVEDGKCRFETVTEYVANIAVIRTIEICSAGGDSPNTDVAGSPRPPRESNLDTVCVREAIEQGLDPFEFCDLPPEEVDVTDVTPDLVAAAMRRVPVPSSAVAVQPPGGETLVNFTTNFFTDTKPFTHRLTLLGQRVDLSLTPTSYSWRFGDGAVEQTTSPGAAYPELTVTHVYGAQQEVRPSVDTTWTATYRLNGGSSRPVPGSLTVAGEPVVLRVITARPRLVG